MTAMLEKKYLKTKPVCEVTFIAPLKWQGESVILAGDFNEWSESTHPMKRQKDGSFKVTVKLDTGREYAFRYLVNGTEWHNDDAADRYQPNGFGEENSIISV
ncbi:MAG: isoamylase early set domain-containing protein [Pleurocapsa minor GSE-CHR-MK-17-07R]|jgi:1,4-alpha-glucan branching enzyme|nr:isoamylase early set domain-containing protein [Pleurocapsa minor GSE-CHR-MK 17-07R]